jgi:molybdopterin synthase sulfur carrier subunit
VILPPHLRTLAHVTGEVQVEVAGDVTQRHVLDAVEEKFPMLVGTMRDRGTGKRRALVRFFACEEDLSNDSPDTALPDRVAQGEEPFLVVGAMAGG